MQLNIGAVFLKHSQRNRHICHDMVVELIKIDFADDLISP